HDALPICCTLREDDRHVHLRDTDDGGRGDDLRARDPQQFDDGDQRPPENIERRRVRRQQHGSQTDGEDRAEDQACEFQPIDEAPRRRLPNVSPSRAFETASLRANLKYSLTVPSKPTSGSGSAMYSGDVVLIGGRRTMMTAQTTTQMK